MSKTSDLTTNKNLHFVSLKIIGDPCKNESAIELFEKREIRDELIKTLIYCIENHELNLYGFVLLPNQFHLIVKAKRGVLTTKINKFKKLSANEIFITISKKLSAKVDIKNRENIEIRRIFNNYLNQDHSCLWQEKDHFIELQIKNDKKILNPISSDELLSHLKDHKRNYMQLGANAFTNLMMETMSF